MYILGDIGNTETKLCLVSKKNKILKKIIFLSKSVNNKQLNSLFKKNKIKLNKIEKILFCSVVPKTFDVIKKFLSKKIKSKCFEVKNLNLKSLIKIKVDYKEVGSDRITNAISLMNNKNNFIILDFGTATTFDVVTKNGIYNGGIIAPGVNLSLNSLIKSADQIPAFSMKKQKKVIGKNTLEALRSGFYWGYTGLINNIISKIEKETRTKYKIIFTGGYANLFKTSINRSFNIDKNITIYGIIEIFKKNKNYLN